MVSPLRKFSEDGLSAIATKIGTPLILDSYTSDMCIQSWGRSSYARAMIELRADVELKDTIMVAMPKIAREDFYTCNIRVECEWKPPRCECCKVFGHIQEECPKNISVGEVKNLKKPNQTPKDVPKRNVEHTKEVSKSNPFNVLNSVENDVVWVPMGRLQIWLVNRSILVDIRSRMRVLIVLVLLLLLKKLIRLMKVTFVDDEGKPLDKVDFSEDYDSEDEVASVDNEMTSFLAKKDGYGTNNLLVQWKKTYENAVYDYDPYDDDMYI
ncbi:hypothetical protein Tco_1148051 [Tanacetum coccineum]